MLQVTTLQHNSAPGAASLGACVPVKALTEADAVDIWIARWLRVRRKDLIERYACDPRRIYEVWQEERFQGSRAKAITLFRERYPALVDRIDYGRHTRVSRAVHPDQLALFE